MHPAMGLFPAAVTRVTRRRHGAVNVGRLVDVETPHAETVGLLQGGDQVTLHAYVSFAVW